MKLFDEDEGWDRQRRLTSIAACLPEQPAPVPPEWSAACKLPYSVASTRCFHSILTVWAARCAERGEFEHIPPRGTETRVKRLAAFLIPLRDRTPQA